MPKIEVNEKHLYNLIGKKFKEEELVEILTGAKAELDEVFPEQGVLKIELNDTNRPDLWSTAGLARQIKSFINCSTNNYSFFSDKNSIKDSGERIVKVDESLKNVRPYITAFIAEGKEIDEQLLIDIIQSQEKLCWNFGQRRKSIAMGIYRSDMIYYPVNYQAADPDKTSFIPLGMDEEMSLREILKEHPKGIEFGSILKDFNAYPFLTDKNGDVLSLPPIINSAHLGAVKVGDNSIFIELTGTDLDSLLLAGSITACDFSDLGFSIKPVKIVYTYDTKYGKEITTPYYFQEDISVDINYANKLLGITLKTDEGTDALNKIGLNAVTINNSIKVIPPVFRNDFLHPVDIVEEIMIAKGMDSFPPIMPEDYTIGRLTGAEEYSRTVREIMVGLGFQEMIYNYLGSKKDFQEKMNITDEGFIEILNPMTENYCLVRKSIIPNLLHSESISGNAVYPHNIFEIGKIAYREISDNYGSKTKNYVGFLCSDREAGFNDINSIISALFYYLGLEYSLEEVEDSRFITGRTGQIIYNNKSVGIMGEIHPDVLENWGIQTPCACVEIDLDYLFE
jgi:phenylalanyl-tRNA synthetase beta chain